MVQKIFGMGIYKNNKNSIYKMDGIFKDILFNVKYTKGSREELVVEVKILYSNDYNKDIEFELMF